MEDQLSDSACRFEVPAELAGERLDRILAARLGQHSRARLQEWIRAGQVQVNGVCLPPKSRLSAGAVVEVTPPAPQADPRVEAQPIAIDIVYEDAELLVINKPPGLVVHPGAGRADGTLQNALLHHRPALQSVPRAGIVHRLDKDTSGLLMVAATESAHTALVRMLQARTVQREYLALVLGRVISGGTVDAPIGRDRRGRKRMGVRSDGRPAVTHYRVQARFARATLLTVRLETGRTHQIRVHLQQAGFPLVGDRQYGSRADPWRAVFARQALHACRLGLTHPASGAAMQWEAPPPPDMQALLDRLRDDEPR